MIDAGRAIGYLEDDWAGSTVRLGSDVALVRVAKTARRIMTCVEQPGIPRDNKILQSVA